MFGFSQGACLASNLSTISEAYSSQEASIYIFFEFNFAIIVADFKSVQVQHQTYYDMDNIVKIPTLHVIGKGNKVIPYEMSMKLTKIYESECFFSFNDRNRNVFFPRARSLYTS